MGLYGAGRMAELEAMAGGMPEELLALCVEEARKYAPSWCKSIEKGTLETIQGAYAIVFGLDRLIQDKWAELEARQTAEEVAERIAAATRLPSGEITEAMVFTTPEEDEYYETGVESFPRTLGEVVDAKTPAELARIALRGPHEALTSAKDRETFRVCIQNEYWDAFYFDAGEVE